MSPQEILTAILGVVASLIGGGAWLAVAKLPNELRTGKGAEERARERAKIELGQLAQEVSHELVSDMREAMDRQATEHIREVARLTEKYSGDQARLEARVSVLESRLQEAVDVIRRMLRGENPVLSAWLYEWVHRGDSNTEEG